MPKRKRSVESTVQNKLEKHRIDIFRALGSAKAFERKRFSSRLREPGITADKKARLEREYGVLKALDLRQTARNHLHSNLLRIKAIEASSDIPEELRAGVPRPNLSPEEITLQNNVISVLCNTGPARQALERAVADICETLGVPVPEKSKRVRKNKRKDAEDQPSDRISSSADNEESDGDDDEDDEAETVKSASKKTKPKASDDSLDEESEFEGFGSDVDKPGSTIGDANDVDESDEEAAISKYDHLLGGSSDDEEEEFDEELLAKYRGKEQVNLDDISLSGSASEVEEEEEEEEDLASESGSQSPLPLPAKKSKKKDTKGDSGNLKEEAKKKTKEKKNDEKASKDDEKRKEKKKATKAAAKSAARPSDSTFLPSLMGGYISGSESASDIDAPPQKKRRGQRARRAIWEQKYGANARHLREEAAKGGRDAGWDVRRGAVGPEDQGRGGKPWHKGGAWRKGNGGGGGGGGGMPPGRDNRGPRARDYVQESRPRPEPKQTKKDDEGPLHPSWEARKKAKDTQKDVTFSGQKIVFD